ncbi:aromatic ring-hydroxylating dioxygenase subunit alpha [Aquicoccus sp. G2-2]|uniref:aromatic ring-hydroxylating dioxygenase subunit alpha n=1 Tax=Aquicoccus sp. G2-2 TaxID=3092120 RepID=UPI002AE000E7|nr:aromatic ring-hydroxylating dioxygenase subunit alpha [Aquicoccus sp. G2-2]MEA1114790.1 aromatic ring-hydroxylating dioxygenase subunit alpha [Aquicoccus sp. G2-2]
MEKKMYLENCWYVAAWDYELIDNKMLSRTILNNKILFYRGDSGDVVALDDRCCHRGAPLSIGRREGDSVRCMYHGLLFAPSGKCIQIPGQDTIPPSLVVRSFPVAEKYGLIWVWTGDPELANPDLIVDLPYMEEPQWKGIPAYIHYDANYLLIIDNLSDFAHLAFVHTNTLGGSEEYAFKTKPVAIERLDDGFRVERWHMNASPPPYHRKVIPNKDDNVDRRNIGHMRVPGVFSLETTFAPAGSGAEKGNLEGARQYRNCQFMTPETERSTHFFHVYLNDFEGADHNISRSLHDSLIEGFMEDKHIIEAQQKLLDADPDFELKAIASDAPLSHFRWLMDKRISAERAGQSATGAGKVASPKPKDARNAAL